MNTDIRALTERVQHESAFIELLGQEASKVIGDTLTRLIPDLHARHAKPAEPGGGGKG